MQAARRARRGGRGHGSGDGGARRAAATDPRRGRPLHRHGLLRGRAGPARAGGGRGPRERHPVRTAAGGDRLLFDLKAYVLRRLARAGVAQRHALAEDTFADEARFFSARRTRRRGGARFGLMLSAIAIAD